MQIGITFRDEQQDRDRCGDFDEFPEKEIHRVRGAATAGNSRQTQGKEKVGQRAGQPAQARGYRSVLPDEQASADRSDQRDGQLH